MCVRRPPSPLPPALSHRLGHAYVRQGRRASRAVSLSFVALRLAASFQLQPDRSFFAAQRWLSTTVGIPHVCVRSQSLLWRGITLAGFWDHPAPKRVGRLRMRVPQSTPRGRSSSTPHGRRPHPRGPASTEPTRADGSAHEACALPHAHAIPTRSQNQYTGAQQRTTSEPTCRSTGWI